MGHIEDCKCNPIEVVMLGKNAKPSESGGLYIYINSKSEQWAKNV